VKTIAITGYIPKLDINDSVACGYRLEKSINFPRGCVNGYIITAAPAKIVTHISFSWCVYVTAFQAQSNGSKYATRHIAWAKGSVQISIRGYEVPSEPSEQSGTPGCF